MLNDQIRTVEGLSSVQQIPFDEYPANGPIMHFSHANGYPPAAYLPLLKLLNTHYHILAMHQRPLWPGTDPSTLNNWEPLADDLNRFLDEHNLQGVIGVGHSVGGTTTLRLALRQPERFRAVVLIDPVIFPPDFTPLWEKIFQSGQAYRLFPLASTTLRRRRIFPDRETMFNSYRRKKVFLNIEDNGLWSYVNAISRDRQDGQIELLYSPEWEARIYVTSALSDRQLWRALPGLTPPLLVLRGEHSDTFREPALKFIQAELPTAKTVKVSGAGHLLPLEKPGIVYPLIQQFLESEI